ncbi:IS701 family transposase [Noviherbaspirillum sp. Root189]|uniref:IS701 family transposase n=1 Tax=Noviherbaspirillum sp. Root189 TaxID=1736487 RepID=UPI000A44CECB|nr:IS701 family transposase [Noviherbaspirillum sp. Root189]
MTTRRPCPPAPGPLEDYALQFDALFHSLAQRHNFRTYLAGLLAPRQRNKTLTALAGTEPLVQAQTAPAQQLQFFLSESNWDANAITARTLQLLCSDAMTTPTVEGVLVIDDTGDRKQGYATDHVARQYLGSVGKIDNGIVAVTSLWANEQRYYPLHVAPYTPEGRLPGGKQDPAFHSKPQIALALVEQAIAAGIAFKAIVADCFYGDHRELAATLLHRQLPFVLSHRGTIGRGWAPVEVAHSFNEAIDDMRLRDWHKVTRHFRDGHVEHWWAVELTFLGYGANKPVRAICATTDRRTLPGLSTWYLTTNLPVDSAPLVEVVRLYGLRHWIEQGYKQMKDELGWADFMVRNDRAIRRHWGLVCCAFAFCWWQEARQARMHHGNNPPVPKKNQPVRLPMRCRWPRLLRSVRAWLTPLDWLIRCWRACFDRGPPTALVTLMQFVATGHGIDLQLRI